MKIFKLPSRLKSLTIGHLIKFRTAKTGNPIQYQAKLLVSSDPRLISTFGFLADIIEKEPSFHTRPNSYR